MAYILNADCELVWQHPVFMRIGSGSRERIRGPQEAIEALDFRWPGKRGPMYFSAKRQCSEALQTQGGMIQGRDAFINAAIEADVLA